MSRFRQVINNYVLFSSITVSKLINSTHSRAELRDSEVLSISIWRLLLEVDRVVIFNDKSSTDCCSFLHACMLYRETMFGASMTACHNTYFNATESNCKHGEQKVIYYQ